jgi:hypothetical protein
MQEGFSLRQFGLVFHVWGANIAIDGKCDISDIKRAKVENEGRYFPCLPL